MKIQIDTDTHIHPSAVLQQQVRRIVGDALDRQDDHVDVVDVHLSDEFGQNGGGSYMNCIIETRIEGHAVLAVNESAVKLDQAVSGAADKLSRLIEHTMHPPAIAPSPEA
jgi:hypothetical protein